MIIDNRGCPAAGAWAGEAVFRLPSRERQSVKELTTVTADEYSSQHPGWALCKVISSEISRELHDHLRGERSDYPRPTDEETGCS